MILNGIVAFLSGFFGAIGVGGGSVLIIYLTLVLDYPQLKAQGINLIFFIPCAFTGIIFHLKNKLIDIKSFFRLAIFGCIGVCIGYYINLHIAQDMLKKVFGIFLFILASVQIYSILKDSKRFKKYTKKGC